MKKSTKYSGFTFVEALVSLLFVAACCLLFSNLVKMTPLILGNIEGTEEKNWHIFLIQLQNEIQAGQLLQTTEQQILFLNEAKQQKMSIGFKNEKIIKQVDNKGYQPLLMNIKMLSFAQEGEELLVKVVFASNQSYEGKIFLNRRLLK